MLLQAFWTFWLMFALDFAWAAYIKWVAHDDIWKASSMASVLMVINGGVVLSYVSNPWMLIPVALGAFSGTYACIALRLRRQGKKSAVSVTFT